MIISVCSRLNNPFLINNHNYFRGSLIGFFKKTSKKNNSQRAQRITSTINKEYEDLGPIKYEQSHPYRNN